MYIYIKGRAPFPGPIEEEEGGFEGVAASRGLCRGREARARYTGGSNGVAGNLPGELRTILHKSRDTPPHQNLGELVVE